METVNRSIAVSINSSRPVAVFLGDYIELYCNHNAIDVGVVSYSWEHLDNLTKLSEDSNILIIPRISKDHLGTYQCVIGSGSGNGRANTTLQLASKFFLNKILNSL